MDETEKAPETTTESEVVKTDTLQTAAAKPEAVKTEGARPVPKQPRWPGQGNSGGIKNAKVGHDRKTSGRGAARGR